MPVPSLDALRATTRDLIALTSSQTPKDLRVAPRGEWSTEQVAAHMADAEMVYSVRIRMVLTDENPMLVGYDQEAWAERLSMCDIDVAGSVDRFRVLREANLRLLESLEPAEWDRFGTHVVDGKMTVANIVERLVGHDRTHLDQIRRLLP